MRYWPLDVFGVHAVGGIVGSLLTGVLASKSVSGVEGSLLVQLPPSQCPRLPPLSIHFKVLAGGAASGYRPPRDHTRTGRAE